MIVVHVLAPSITAHQHVWFCIVTVKVAEEDGEALMIHASREHSVGL
jgi:hypothetical protein